MLAPKLLELSSAVGMTAAGLFAATAAPVAAGIDLPFFSPFEYAAAVAGAGIAEMWRLVAKQDREPSAERIWRNALKGGFGWLCGSLFGLFLGSIPASLAAVNAPAGAFLMGLLSNGVITALLNPKLASEIAEGIAKGIAGAAQKMGGSK